MAEQNVNGNEINEVNTDDNAPVTMRQLKSIFGVVEDNMAMLAEGLEEANAEALDNKEWYDSLDRKEQLDYDINKYEEKHEKKAGRLMKSLKRKHENEIKALNRSLEAERKAAIGNLDDERDVILAQEADEDLAILDRKTRKLGRTAGATAGKVTRPVIRGIKSIWSNLK